MLIGTARKTATSFAAKTLAAILGDLFTGREVSDHEPPHGNAT
jgi:hypothetical protein